MNWQLSFGFQSPGMLLELTEQVSHFHVGPKLIDCRALGVKPGSSCGCHVLFLPPLCLPAAALQPPARRSWSRMWESGIPTQPSTREEFLNQLGSCSVNVT